MTFLRSHLTGTFLTYYRQLYKSNMRLKTWLYINRRTDAKIDPFNIVFISPHDIYYSERNHTVFNTGFFPDIQSGGWDKNTISLSIEKNELYSSFKDRFQNNVDWSETKYFDQARRILYNKGSWKECSNYDELRNKFKSYDRIYNSICENGYRTQRELEEDGEITKNSMPLGLYIKPPEIREVTIDIGRDGGYIWHSGGHRVIIATIADVEKIPVRIRGRHKQWQAKREAALAGKYRKTIDHPDLFPVTQ